MKLYNRVVQKFFTRGNENRLSDLLTIITTVIVLNLIDYPDGWNFGILLMSTLVISLILFLLLGSMYKYLLSKRNIEVGLGSYMLGAAVIATVNTLVDLYLK